MYNHFLFLLQYATSLTGDSFDEARMLQNIEACEWLTGALRGLEIPNLDPAYANMRAVCSLPFKYFNITLWQQYFALLILD